MINAFALVTRTFAIQVATDAAIADAASDLSQLEAILTKAGTPADGLHLVEQHLKYLPGNPNLLSLRDEAVCRVCLSLEQRFRAKESQQLISQYLKESPDSATLLAWRDKFEDRVCGNIKTRLEQEDMVWRTLDMTSFEQEQMAWRTLGMIKQ